MGSELVYNGRSLILTTSNRVMRNFLTLGRPKWIIRDPMLQQFNKFMRLNADNSFMLRVFLNCVYLLYHATC
jgi:hypothetical protein